MLIVHLSDIHFRKSEVQTAQDPNFHLRNELLRDVEELCRTLGDATLVIVSGDVAFAGDVEEYIFATAWLEELCKRCGAETSAIFVIPGNHDVDRKVADKALVQLLHKELKTASEIALDGIMRDFLTDDATARLLYESIDNYNSFAQQFLCDLLPPDRTRTYRDLILNDGSTLRVWGLNTAFVSSTADKPNDLFLDSASMQITRQTGVVNLVAAHHHLSWLRRSQTVEDHLNDVAPIQIFGHVHTNRIVRDPDWIRLTASAVHPDRHEAGWEPGYNIIQLNVEGDNGSRQLHITAHVRVWQAAPGGFRAKQNKQQAVFEHRIPLDPWEKAHGPTETPDPFGKANLDVPSAAVPSTQAMTLLRDIGVRFYRLSFSKKSEIAGRLELLEEADMNQPDFERFRRVFLRAHDRNKLQDLMHAVEEAEKS